MIKSFATFARIHWPSEYNDYLNDKAYGYSRKKIVTITSTYIVASVVTDLTMTVSEL